MARRYLFFLPARLPLEPDDLDASTTRNFEDGPALRAQLERAFPGLAWRGPHVGSADVDGNWYEVSVPHGPELTLSVRCSLRTDHDAFVQALCDRLGWLAFDETPRCFQPHRAPFRV
jgi:hypothetical protein